MSVEITPPNQLGFTRPLTRLVTQTIRIHNPHPQPIAFKVKTTAPKQYCVRPNAGRVESGESVEVQVLLQPLASEPPPHAKCKDKFLVQSAYISPDEEMRTLTEMWSETEKTNKAAIQEQKIKCVYLAPEDGVAQNGIKEEDEQVEESRIMDESAIFANAHSSPTNPMHTNGEVTKAPIPTSAVPASSSKPINVPVPETSHATEHQKEIPSLSVSDIKTSGAPTNVALERGVDATTSSDDKLKAALAEIEKLKNQLADSLGPQVTGLRKRGNAAGEAVAAGAEQAVEKVQEVAQTTVQQGVPIEVVACLVVGVFVMTYLFF